MRNENSSEVVFTFWEMSLVAFWVNNYKYVGPSSVYWHITLKAVGSFCYAKCSGFSYSLCFPLFSLLLWLLSIYFIYTFSIYSYSFSIYYFSINTSHPPLPTYHYFKPLPFLLLLKSLTCSIFSQATLNPAQSERKKESQPETSTTRHIQYRHWHRFQNPTSAQVIMFSLSPSVNSPCSVLCSSKFQCLYFKVFVQVLCFDFVCVSMFFSISLNIDGFCKIMKFVSNGICVWWVL